MGNSTNRTKLKEIRNKLSNKIKDVEEILCPKTQDIIIIKKIVIDN